ncbi:uncharacterized protein LOC120634343 [Pararge aegeria]|uniref:uncharacterized protein LOC120634343 n=1 Tax=Pararge aegeria TaxID=116150 RepID=UPI0019D1A222|nr:uncharacterized protein LOC120634343 [Pararge aegeria]
MKVLCAFLIVAVAACAAAPGSIDDNRIELFSGVAIEKDSTGDEKIKVNFEPGELKEAARTFEEARGKIKKYAPLLAGIGVKVVAVIGLLFGALTLMVTKALVVAKLAFLAATALGVHKYLGGEGFGSISKASGFGSAPQQWTSPTAQAATYPYARSVNAQDANDLAYKAQIPS